MTKKETYFELLSSFGVNYSPVVIRKWRSSRTGLQICYINQPSPVVRGYFVVATEIENNSGCPHTLEHLVFMGSKQYPYKGLLDTLGNRFFSDTNAWTSVDQTVYNLTSTGWQGFKTLLPIYLDHVLNPTLTDEACLTEVYHIDGKGEEKGVVFCEMQGIEPDPGFQLNFKMQQTLYAPDSGYSSETGGLLKELRRLTNDQIREFHALLYRPDNLSVVIAGTIDEEEMLNIMSKFDADLEPLPAVPKKRPFVDSVHDEPLKEEIVEEMEFPEEDESMGEAFVSWLGPKFDDTLANEALDMVGSYFTDNTNSIFNKHLVEIEDPIATNSGYYTDNYWRTGVNFTFSGVPTERLHELDVKVKELIKEQADPKNFDLKFMHQLIQKERWQILYNTEREPSYFQDCAIYDFLYSPVDSDNFKEWVDYMRWHDVLLTWDTDQWCKFIQEQFIDNKSATILGKPSAKLNKSLKKEAKKFKKETIAKYGKDGLKKLSDKLEAARVKNDSPIPDLVLNQFGKPDPKTIKFIETKSYKAGDNDLSIDYETSGDFYNKLQKDALHSNPLFMHFEDFKSSFVTINVVMSSKNVNKKYLRYFSIFEELFQMAIQYPDGTYLSHEEVVNQLNNDLTLFEFDNGFGGGLLEFITIRVRCEVNKYKSAIDWIYKIMTLNVIEKDRIKVIAEKINNSLVEKKRDGEYMVYSNYHRNFFTDGSIRRAQDSIHNDSFYKDLIKDIEEDNFDKIYQELSEFKTQLFTSNNFKVFVNGNCSSLENPISDWKDFISAFEPQAETIKIDSLPRSYQFRNENGKKCSNEAHLISMEAIDSSTLIVLTPLPTDYLHDDIFKLTLACEYLNAVEGPFWRGIRGKGLAYGTTLLRNVETGYLNFSLMRSSDIVQAWNTAKQIVDDFCNNVTPFDKYTMENCVSSIINEVANGESSFIDASFTKIEDNILKRRGPNFNKLLVEKLMQVTEEDLSYVMNKYLKLLFDASSSAVFSSIPSSNLEGVKQFFDAQGYNVETELINSEKGLESDDESADDSEFESDSDLDSESDSDLDSRSDSGSSDSE